MINNLFCHLLQPLKRQLVCFTETGQRSDLVMATPLMMQEIKPQRHLECTSKMTKDYKCPPSPPPLLFVGVDSCLVKPKFKVKHTGIL